MLTGFAVWAEAKLVDSVKRGDHTLYIGEVGWYTWEEMNVGKTGGLNFGWPCYEGMGQSPEYPAATPSHAGCGTLGTSENPATQVTSPVAAWNHSNDALSVPAGFFGNCAVGGGFYTGTQYPAPYQGRYFFADYGKDWMYVATMNASDQVVSVSPFGTAMDGPVDFNRDPVTGDVIYVAINTSQVRRIRYTGTVSGNGPPTAVISASPTSGPAPLAVNFSAAGSTDPENDPLTYTWFFGDGTTSNQRIVSHTYLSAGTFNAQLTVSDPSGGQDVKTIAIIAGASASSFPTTGVLDDFNRSDGPLGGFWAGDPGGLNISSSQMVQTCCSPAAVWDGAVFGANQEAYLTFTASSATADEQDLMLKTQGTSYAGGYIEVRYTAAQHVLGVSTYTGATGWVACGNPISATFAAGDQFGARALGDGTIEVYKNGVKILSVSAGAWPYATQGGRLGFIAYGASASRYDNFGGGNVVFNSNTKPTATSSPDQRLVLLRGPDRQLMGRAPTRRRRRPASATSGCSICTTTPTSILRC